MTDLRLTTSFFAAYRGPRFDEIPKEYDDGCRFWFSANGSEMWVRVECPTTSHDRDVSDTVVGRLLSRAQDEADQFAFGLRARVETLSATNFVVTGEGQPITVGLNQTLGGGGVFPLKEVITHLSDGQKEQLRREGPSSDDFKRSCIRDYHTALCQGTDQDRFRRLRLVAEKIEQHRSNNPKIALKAVDGRIAEIATDLNLPGAARHPSPFREGTMESMLERLRQYDSHHRPGESELKDAAVLFEQMGTHLPDLEMVVREMIIRLGVTE